MEKKVGWVVEPDFYGNFQVNVICFFLPFTLASLTE